MAKSLLLWVLVEYLGEYVEGLDSDNLRVGVLSGKLEFTNLKLRRSALDALDIPVEVSHGCLQSLQVSVPWTALDKKPVKVSIDGLLLQAVSIDVLRISKADLRERILNAKRKALQKFEMEVEALLNKRSGDDSASAEGLAALPVFAQRLIMKILDNLEITITNVHMRFEDSMMVPGLTFAAGITLQSFSISTCDEHWNLTFVVSDHSRAKGVNSHKMIRIENVGVYWFEDTQALEPLNNTAWEREMKRILTQPSVPSSAGRTERFILEPLNIVVLKLILRDQTSSTSPRIDLLLEGVNMQLSLSKNQLHQLISTIQMFVSLGRLKLIALYRPKKSPVVDPRAWWKYAFYIVAGKSFTHKRKIDEALACFGQHRRYLSLIKMQKELQASYDGKPKRAGHTSADIVEKELTSLETTLPLCALCVFRSLAVEERLREAAKLSATLGDTRKEPSSSSWFSWMPSNQKAKFNVLETQEEELTFARIQKELQDNMQRDVSVQGEIYLVRISLKSGNFDLDLVDTTTASNLAHCVLNVSCIFDIFSTRLAGQYSVNSICIADLCTSRPIIPNILCPKETSDSTPPFFGVFKTNEGPSKDCTIIDIKSSSLRICLNDGCIIKLLDFFIPKVYLDDTGVYLRDKLDSLISPSYIYRSAMYGTGSLVLKLDIDAPIIVLPIDSSVDRGGLILDMGHLLLTADIGTNDFEVKSKLYDVFMCLPPSVSYDRIDNTHDLLEPFSLSLVTGSRNREIARANVSLKIIPGLNLILDIDRFGQCLEVVCVVMKIIETLIPRKSEVEETTNTQIVNKSSNFAKMETKIVVVSLLNFIMKLPFVSLKLHGATPNSFFSFSINDLFLSLNSRNVDLSLTFNVGSITVNEYTGRKIIWTDFGARSRSATVASSPEQNCVLNPENNPNVAPLVIDDTPVEISEKPLDRARVLYGRVGEAEDELQMSPGEILIVLKREGDWWYGSRIDNPSAAGYFPCNYVQLLPAIVVLQQHKQKLVRATVLYSNPASNPDDLDIVVGQTLVVLDQDGEWWYGYVEGRSDIIGYFPYNYVKIVEDTSSDSSQEPMSVIFEPNSPIKQAPVYPVDRNKFTPMQDDATAPSDFISIKIANITSPASPLYTSYTTLIDIEMADLGVNFDTTHLSFISPYLALLSASPIFDAKVSENERFSTRSRSFSTPTVINRRRNLTTATPDKATLLATSNEYEGLKLTIRIGCIALGLFSVDNEVLLTEETVGRINGAYLLKMEDLTTLIEIKTISNIYVSLLSFTITDQRPSSDDFHYRTILSKSPNFRREVDIEPTIVPSPTPSESADGDILDTSGEPATDEMKPVASVPRALSDAFLIVALQIDPTLNFTEIEIALQDVTVYLFASVIFHVIALVEEYTRAIQSTVNVHTASRKVSITRSERSKLMAGGTPPDIRQLQRKSFEKVHHEGNNKLSVIVRLVNPSLILLEDPTESKSHGVMLKLETTICFVNEIKNEGVWNKSTDTLQISLSNFSFMIFCNAENIDDSNTKILDPCALEFQMIRNFEMGELLSDVFAVTFDEISIRFTTSNILFLYIFIYKILSAHTKPFHVVEKEPEDFNDDDDVVVDVSKAKVDISTQHEIALCGKSIHLIFLDDTHRRLLPMFNVSIDKLEYTLAGSGPSLRGRGELTFKTDYYNVNVGVWEPVVELFSLNTSVNISPGDVGISIGSDTCVQLDVSTRMLRSTIQLVTSLQLIEQTAILDSTDLAENDIAIENFTGLDVVVFADGLEILIPSHDWKVCDDCCVGYVSSSMRFVDIKVDTGSLIHNLPVYSNKPTSLNIVGIENESNGLELVWEPVLESNGARKIRIRSSLVLKNCMDFPIMYRVNISGQEFSEIGPLVEGAVVYVPMRSRALVESLNLRPTTATTNWSNKFEVARLSKQNEFSLQSFVCTDRSGSLSFSMNITHEIHHSSLVVSCVPNIVITNSLPCMLRYRFVSDGEVFSDGMMYPGRLKKVAHSSSQRLVGLQICVGDFDWSAVVRIYVDLEGKLDISPLGNKAPNKSVSKPQEQTDGVCLGYYVTLAKGLAKIKVYSKYLFLDRTGGLDLCFQMKNSSGGNVVRKAYLSTIPPSSSTPSKKNQTNIVLENLTFSSARKYAVVSQVGVGTSVYSDSSLQWRYLPPYLLGSTYISTAREDSVLKRSSLIEFSVNEDCYVLVYRCTSLRSAAMKWLAEEKYHALSERLVAFRNFADQNREEELFFKGYGKLYSAGSTVTLGGNTSFDTNSLAMYVVFVVRPSSDAFSLDLRQQVNPDMSVLENFSLWTNGDCGLCIFHAHDDTFKTGVRRGGVWSNKLSLDGTLSVNTFDVQDAKSSNGFIYQLAYKVSSLPEPYGLTRVVTIVPRYVVVNCTSDVISIKQSRKDSPIDVIDPWSFKPWHPFKTSDADVFVKFEGTKWSVCPVDLNEVGSSSIMVPSIKDQQLFLSIDVKLASHTENSYINVIIRRASIKLQNAPLSIKNESMTTVYVQQDGLSTDALDESYAITDFTLACPTGSWIPFGWATRTDKNKVKIGTGRDSSHAKFLSNSIDMNGSDEMIQEGGLIFTVKIWGPGRVLIIKDSSTVRKSPSVQLADVIVPSKNTAETTINISMNLQSLAVSIFVSEPTVRELFSVYIENIKFVYKLNNLVEVCEFNVDDLLVDSYCSDDPNSPTSVLLYTFHRASTKHKQQVKGSFFSFSYVRVVTEPGMITRYKYIALLLLECYICIDSPTIFITMNDIVENLIGSISSQSSESWVDTFNYQLTSYESRRQILDIQTVLYQIQATKLYFENLIVHPVKVHITFVRSIYSRSAEEEKELIRKYFWLKFLQYIELDDVVIKLNAFAVENAMESIITLNDRIVAKLLNDLQRQLLQLVGQVLFGSLDIFGKPVGLAKNIGDGLQDLFYEPRPGLMEDPEKFVVGIGKDTGKLVTGIISGAISSGANIVESASNIVIKGATLVSGENEKKPKRGGGLAGGGIAVASGITNGITGIITKPVEGAKRGGLIGFAKGIGLGIIGAATNPIIGLSEGLSSIAHEVSSQLTNKTYMQHRRPKRFLQRCDCDSSERVLTDINLVACYAQLYIDIKGVDNEDLIDVIPYDEKYVLIMTSVSTYLMNKKTYEVKSDKVAERKVHSGIFDRLKGIFQANKSTPAAASTTGGVLQVVDSGIQSSKASDFLTKPPAVLIKPSYKMENKFHFLFEPVEEVKDPDDEVGTLLRELLVGCETEYLKAPVGFVQSKISNRSETLNREIIDLMLQLEDKLNNPSEETGVTSGAVEVLEHLTELDSAMGEAENWLKTQITDLVEVQNELNVIESESSALEITYKNLVSVQDTVQSLVHETTLPTAQQELIMRAPETISLAFSNEMDDVANVMENLNEALDHFASALNFVWSKDVDRSVSEIAQMTSLQRLSAVSQTRLNLLKLASEYTKFIQPTATGLFFMILKNRELNNSQSDRTLVLQPFPFTDLIHSGLAQITYVIPSVKVEFKASNFSGSIFEYNPLMQAQRVFHELLLDEASVFIEKTLVIAPELRPLMQKEYVKAMKEFYKSHFKTMFKEIQAASHFKKIQLNYELAEKCPLSVAMSFTVPVRFQQTIQKATIDSGIAPTIPPWSMLELVLLLSLPVIDREIFVFETIFDCEIYDMPMLEGDTRPAVEYLFSAFSKSIRAIITEIDSSLYGVEALAMYTVLQRFCKFFSIREDTESDITAEKVRLNNKVSIFFKNEIKECKEMLVSKIDDVLKLQLAWIKNQKCNPKTPGIFSPILKLPSILDSLLEVFGGNNSLYVDEFYREFLKGVLDWFQSIIDTNTKYGDVVRISNLSYLVEALDIRGVRPQTTTHNAEKNVQNVLDLSFDVEVLCSRSIPPSVDAFITNIQLILVEAQQNYILWMISYEFPGISLLIERLNNAGSRVNKHELALFVRRQDVVRISKDLEPKVMIQNILALRRRLRKHFNSVDLESLEIEPFLWSVMKSKLLKSLKRIHESADASFQISFLSSIELVKTSFDDALLRY